MPLEKMPFQENKVRKQKKECEFNYLLAALSGFYSLQLHQIFRGIDGVDCALPSRAHDTQDMYNSKDTFICPY